MDEFAKTRLGHEFLRCTLPKLAKEIGRVADGLEALNEILGDPRTCPKCGTLVMDRDVDTREHTAGADR